MVQGKRIVVGVNQIPVQPSPYFEPSMNLGTLPRPPLELQPSDGKPGALGRHSKHKLAQGTSGCGPDLF
jgi:hypothetical protein